MAFIPLESKIGKRREDPQPSSQTTITIRTVKNLQDIHPGELVEGLVVHDISANMLFGWKDNRWWNYKD